MYLNWFVGFSVQFPHDWVRHLSPIWNESKLRSDEHYMSNSENKTWKKKKRIQAFTGFEPMTSAIPAQCSANRADMPIRAGHYFDSKNPWIGEKMTVNIWKQNMWIANEVGNESDLRNDAPPITNL